MKIAVISTMGGSPWGGSEELWAAMASEALKARHAVTASVYGWPSLPPRLQCLEAEGARIARRPRPQRRGRCQRILQRIIGERSAVFLPVFRFAPDVVFINQGATYDVPDDLPSLAQALYTAAIPYVVICHGNSESYHPSPQLRSAAIEFFSRAHAVAFASQRTQRTTERQLARSMPNAVVLRNPVNMRDITPAPWPSPEPARLAVVARLDAGKGHDVLFECLSAPAWQSRDWRLRVYGDGPDRQYFEALAEFYGVSQRVEFPGHATDIRAVWADNHLLVLPSRSEGMPLAVVEAMLCGRPCVVTDVGGNAEWVEEGVSGFIAPAATARALSGALEQVWAARTAWSEMGIKAHEDARQRFDPHAGRTLLNVLEQAADCRRKVPAREGTCAISPAGR
jgi:glycosyltransferase involved in cell wall biosynthesis